MENFSILLEKIIGISTDGAQAMSSMEVGVSGRLFQVIKKVTEMEIFVNHCIIHQENLCAKRLSLLHFTVPIIKLINFIKSRALNHRKFKESPKELETEYGNLVFNTKIRWLSRGAMLTIVYNLKKRSTVILGYAFHHFGNEEWMYDFGFLINITQHLNIFDVLIIIDDPVLPHLAQFGL